MSAVPNPVFDVAGITAGIMRIPVGLFLLAACAGNVLKATVVAFAGAGTAMLLGPTLQNWFGR
jgi:membrane protein DedA with SNARE-associated domain